MLFYMFSGSWSSSIANFQSIVVTGFFVYVGYSVGAVIVSISHCFSFFLVCLEPWLYFMYALGSPLYL